MYKYLSFIKNIDRRSPRNMGDFESPWLRENWLSRDGCLRRPSGTERLGYYESYGYDSYTKLLLHLTNTFKDEIGNTPTVYEDAYIQKTDGVFGTPGCAVFDGTGDYVSFADSADWNFSTGDFTIDFWVKFSDLTNAQVIIGQYVDADNFWYIQKGTNAAGNKWRIYFERLTVCNCDYVMTAAWSGAVANTWYHVQISRSTTSILLYINGVKQTLTATVGVAATDLGDLAATLNIGQQNSASYLNGKLRELRVSKGIARNTDTYKFAYPTDEYMPTTGSGGLSNPVTWMRRYYTLEVGQVSPRTYAYTTDGKLWRVDDISKTVRLVLENMNRNAHPKAWVFKTTEQYYMFLVDGKDTYYFDGNNDDTFEKLALTDVDGNSILPIDVIEHKDRLFLLTKTSLKISENLDPKSFNSATDSADIIVGSGQALNKGLAKIEDRLYVGTTLGSFALEGDVISALAPTFELRLVDQRPVMCEGVYKSVENGIMFVGDDLELYSFNGHSSEMLSYYEKLSDFMNPSIDMLGKAVSTYEDNYFKMSFVETGDSIPRLELWWDALEKKIDFVRGRNVGCYMESDRTREDLYRQIGRSDIPEIMWVDRGGTFDNHPIITKLWTKDITIEKGMNIRFLGFYPEFEPTGNRYLTFTYFLDGKIGVTAQFPKGTTTGESVATFDQSLRGEYEVGSQLGGTNVMRVDMQNQFIDSVTPKIMYSRGTSISFLIIDSTLEEKANFLGMGIEYVKKQRKKGKKVAQ